MKLKFLGNVEPPTVHSYVKITLVLQFLVSDTGFGSTLNLSSKFVKRIIFYIVYLIYKIKK